MSERDAASFKAAITAERSTNATPPPPAQCDEPIEVGAYGLVALRQQPCLMRGAHLMVFGDDQVGACLGCRSAGPGGDERVDN